MTKRTLTVIAESGGQFAVGDTVTAGLVGRVTENAPWRPVTGYVGEVVETGIEASAVVPASGTLTMELEPNVNITPENTGWQLKAGGSYRRDLGVIAMPDEDATFSSDLLIDTPTPLVSIQIPGLDSLYEDDDDEAVLNVGVTNIDGVATGPEGPQGEPGVPAVFATSAETIAGVETAKGVSPAGLAAWLANRWVNCFKAADESVTSSEVLQDDNELTVSLLANATYVFNGVIWVVGATSGDIELGLFGPSGATGSVMFGGLGTAGTGTGGSTQFDITAVGSTASRGTTPTVLGINVVGHIITSSTAGAALIKWCQDTSSGTATTIKAGSWLRFQRIA